TLTDRPVAGDSVEPARSAASPGGPAPDPAVAAVPSRALERRSRAARARRGAYRLAMDRLLDEPRREARTPAVSGADGTPIHVVEYGPEAAVPIVLSHGWACSSRMWNPQVNDLAGQYRVICYDQRGRGATPAGSAPATVETLADDL